MSSLYDAQHWRRRAEEMRRIAEEYERLAVRALERMNGKDQG
jgi:hypothetical protein